MSRPNADVWNVTSCILTEEVRRGWSAKDRSVFSLQAAVRSKTAHGNAMRATLLLLETKFMGSKFALDDGRRLTGASQSYFCLQPYNAFRRQTRRLATIIAFLGLSANLLPPALWIVGKIHQPIPVIDLHIDESQCCKPERARNFRSNVIADAGQIKRDQVLVFLAQVSKLQDRMVCPENVIHRSADTLHRGIGITVHLGYLARCRRSDVVRESPCIDHE